MIDVAAASRIYNSEPTFDVKIDVDNIRISIEDIRSRMSNASQPFDTYFDNIINYIFSHLSEKCHIQAGYVIYPGHFDQKATKKFRAGSTYFNMGKIITSQLKKSEQTAVFACTIGSDMENWSRQALEGGEAVLGYLIDTVASAVTEKAVDYLHHYISTEMAKMNLNVTNRYSPGYCDWPVSDQPLLFSLLPENFCGINLSASALMCPIKSVSGVIGIGPEVKYEEYLCDRCNMKDCTYRVKHIKVTNL
ncbi:MAG: vitamin B12 dependent-methionine synthase activation domain-containing protein [Calditrichaceae bacterium]